MGVMKFWLPVLFAQLRGISTAFCCLGLAELTPTGAVDAYFLEVQLSLVAVLLVYSVNISM